MEAGLNLQAQPLTLVKLVEALTGESEVEERLRLGSRLQGPRVKKVLDPSFGLGFRDDPIEPDEGYAEFQHWLSDLLKQVRAAADDGNWVFHGLAARSPTFPQLDAGYIRHSRVDLLQNEIGEYRAIEVSPARALTEEERCVHAMRRLMNDDPDRRLLKPQIYEIIMGEVPSLKTGTLRDVWMRLTNSEFPDYKTKGPRRKRN